MDSLTQCLSWPRAAIKGGNGEKFMGFGQELIHLAWLART
jgi:hypothetical protein